MWHDHYTAMETLHSESSFRQQMYTVIKYTIQPLTAYYLTKVGILFIEDNSLRLCSRV